MPTQERALLEVALVALEVSVQGGDDDQPA